jgi:hypothetical protein
MYSVAPPRSPEPPDATRQQLDELDALLRRMLAVPVNQLPEELLTQAASAVAVPPTQAAASEPPKKKIEPPAPARPAPIPAHGKDGGPVGPTVTVAAPPITQPPEPAAIQEENGSGWFAPLIWSNQLFDATVAWLGPPGRWLRSDWGRFLLGWSGILLVIGALAWGLIDWVGWTR